LQALQTLRVCLFGLAKRQLPRTLGEIWAGMPMTSFTGLYRDIGNT